MDLQNFRSKALKCPRCDSSDTKFCYYNNYNYSQPRHFCKTCRRYWTIGGILRNIPIGGGSRKSKNPKRKSSQIGRDPNPTLSNSPGRVLLVRNMDIGDRSAVDSSTVVTDSSSSVPFVLGCIDGTKTTPLKRNQAADCYCWIENGRDCDRTVEKRFRGEGFGPLDLLGSEGMVEICSGVDLSLCPV